MHTSDPLRLALRAYPADYLLHDREEALDVLLGTMHRAMQDAGMEPPRVQTCTVCSRC
jgi:hypothetical protein